MKWLGLMVIGLLVAVGLAYETVPNHTTDATHFDTLIVLGCPSNPDGSASPEQQSRVDEAVREFRAGRAAHIILTGAAAHNRFIEAEEMKQLALAQGVPESALEEEPQALNTIQNIYYSHALMEKHGWESAEVISTGDHLPRTALILEHWRFPWRTHAAPWPEHYSWRKIARECSREVLGTAELRWFGFQTTPFLPGS